MINFIGSNVICVICPSPQSGDAAEYRRWADACARQTAGPRASGDVSPAHTGCR